MATRADAGAQAGISPPEPDLTPQQMIDRAVALGLPRRGAGNLQTPRGTK